MTAALATQPRSWCFGLDHLIRIRRDQLAFYNDLRSRYGDVILLKLGPYRSWILFHPAPIEALLTDQWASFIRFKKLTDVVAQWNGDSLLLAEGDEWRERRRKVLPAFQTRRLTIMARWPFAMRRSLLNGSMRRLTMMIALHSTPTRRWRD